MRPVRSPLAALCAAAVLAACGSNPQPAPVQPQAAAPERPAPAQAAPPAAPTPAPAPAATPTPASAPAAAPTPAPAPAATPAPAPAPAPAAPAFELAGEWDWTSLFQGQPYAGTLSLRRGETGLTGTIVVTGMFDGVVRDVVQSGADVRITLDSPQGELVIVARFENATSLNGRVDVISAGDSGAFSATKR